MNGFKLEIANDNEFLGLLEGDEVLVSTVEQPRSNGKDLAVFKAAGERFVSTFTRFGFSYEHYLYSFLYRKRKHLIHQYLHVYGLPFSVHKIVYIP
ncbi:hypothetical protein AMS59_15810 [Lysinibacillus sp. FJAT-14745]|uniref:hypothetical protein n=1 Tax=Lysinibacillus sp. FJAT-14745 TaxID=1704289 RepID=UPI0006AB8EF8|nr:hypothetical protein [Lysinibacillus sp. FJAT-14745]KOP72395.1 hypothetical protein AMS59_15810 [Lysinibacillus sp. FJAT-14745]